jgi:hypothetical protein
LTVRRVERIKRRVALSALALGAGAVGTALAGTGFETCTVAADCQAGTRGLGRRVQ